MGDKPKVIIADGSSTFRMYFSTVLNRMNYEALPVESADDVLPLARVVRPSLITLDAHLADGGGLALLRRLRIDDQLGATPVILLSGDAADEQAARQAGCCSFMIKPVDLRQLHFALQHCLPHSYRRQHLRAPLARRVSGRVQGQSFECLAVTLSEGGIYLRMGQVPEVGAKVEIELPLSRRELLLLSGEVIYTKERHSGVFAGMPGVAVCFSALHDSVQERLSEEVKQLLAGDVAKAQTEPVVRIG